MLRRIPVLIAQLLLFSFASTGSFAQITTGTVTGTVSDQTGAVLPGVSLKLVNVGTGETQTQTTGTAGEYRFTYLPVGQYTLRAELKGFATAERKDIKISVNETGRQDFELKTGQANETVEVSGTPPALETESASVGGVVEHEAIVNLPLNGRDFLTLVALQPGGISTAKLPGGGESFVTVIHGGNFSLHGAPAEDTEYLLDGVTVRDNGGTNVMVRPIVDAIEEFNYQASNYSAAFGNVDGGVINITTRSGSNKFHGGVWEYFRNNVLDGRNYFDGPEKPPFRQNQFGASLGGAIKKDKLFFFTAYEGLRSSKELTQAATVPTVAERNGDFSGGPPIFNPLEIDGSGQRVPFANNQIPESSGLWSPPAVAALGLLFPLPNRPGSSNNLVQSADRIINSNQLVFKVDWNVWEKDKAFVRYTWFNTQRTLPFQFSALPNFSSIWNSPAHNVVLGETHLFSSRTLNDLKVGLNRPSQILEDIDQHKAIDQQLGIGGTSTMFLGNPNINIAGLSGTGAISNAPNDRTQNDYSIVDNFSHSTGAHNLQFGGSNVWHQINGGFNPGAHGVFNFSNSFTSQLADGTSEAGTGNPVADFLLGFPITSSRCCIELNGFRHWRRWNFGAYFQDDWKVSSRLTLNLGVRYDYHSVTVEKDNRFSQPDLSAAPAFNLLLAGTGGVSRGIVKPTKRDFAPRFGFAYSITPAFVVRGGYSLNFNDINQEYTFDVDGNLPFAAAQTFFSSSVTPQLTLANAFPASLEGTSSAFAAIDPNIRDPYVQHWNLSLERAFGFGTTVSASYIGNKGNDLVRWGADANAPPAGPGAIGPRRPIPDISTVTFTGGDGNSIYHGLELKGEKQFSHGLSFLLGYVWSKCIDNGAIQLIGDGSATPIFVANPTLDRELNRGRCQYDVPQRFNGNLMYELPFGKNSSGLARALVGGWQVQTIFDVQAGQPFTVLLPNDNSNTGQFLDHADLVAGQDPNNGPKTPQEWFNVNAFGPAAPFTYGNSGRDIVNGPRYTNVDFSVFKTFVPAEGQVISFRTEIFNIFNHPNFFQPGNKFATPTFGVISGAFDSREIQFGLKYTF
jgi:hypothetical protein